MRISRLYDATWKIQNKAASKLLYKVNKCLVNVLYPRTVKLHYGVDEHSNVIVSLTSFPDRIQTVWITIATILNQTVKPQKVILWLASEQFPQGEAELPQNLLKFKQYGLTIRFCENLYSHKKYFYAMKENPESTVITVDDDIFYPEYLIERLLEVSRANPGAICCTWAHELQYDEQGNVKPYSAWKKCVYGSEKPSLQLMAVGCGGILYPPHMLNEEVFNIEAIQQLCPRTDDIWLKFMAVKQRTPAVRIPYPQKIFFSQIRTQSKGLHYENVGQNKNDIAIHNVLSHYPECLDILRKDLLGGR